MNKLSFHFKNHFKNSENINCLMLKCFTFSLLFKISSIFKIEKRSTVNFHILTTRVNCYQAFAASDSSILVFSFEKYLETKPSHQEPTTVLFSDNELDIDWDPSTMLTQLVESDQFYDIFIVLDYKKYQCTGFSSYRLD